MKNETMIVILTMGFMGFMGLCGILGALRCF